MDKLTSDNLQLFMVFVVPGFVALKVYRILVPGEKIDLGAAFFEAVSYSMINLAVMSWAIVGLRREGFAEAHTYLFPLGMFSTLFLSPIALAVAVYKFRISPWVRRWVLHPAPTGWDFFFSQKRACFLLFRFRDGKLMGGFFGKNSFASAYPREPEVYVEEIWRVDEHGRFSQKVDGTSGTFVRLSDCERVEIFEAREEA